MIGDSILFYACVRPCVILCNKYIGCKLLHPLIAILTATGVSQQISVHL